MAYLRKISVFILSFCLILSIGSEVAFARPIRIGYYSGTFDPPTTLGHRDLLLRSMAAADLDLVFIMPSITNAQKPDATPYALRKQMVQLTFSDLPQVIIPDIEIEEAFKIDRAVGVLHVIFNRYPGAKMFRITGDDVIARNYNPAFTEDPRLRDVGMIIGQRGGKYLANHVDISQFDFSGRELIILPVSEDTGFSSSQVKPLLFNGTPDSEIPVHPEVLKLIREQQIYSPLLRCENIFARAG